MSNKSFLKMGNVLSKLRMTNDQLICALLGCMPSLLLLIQLFMLSTDKKRKAKCYHISSNWTLRFLYLTLTVTPIKEITQWNRIIPLRQTFGLLSFYYSCIHVLTYLRYTLIKDGYSVAGFLFQIEDRPYLIYGVCAWLCMLPLAITSNMYFKSTKRLGYKNWKKLHRLVYIVLSLAVYHVLTRNWDRIARDKSPVEAAVLAPYFFIILLGYRITKWVYCKWFKPSPSNHSNDKRDESFAK
eukprot:617605_1